ncbi:hypothetical protein D3C73_1311480 [compost metagenome]
MAVMGFEQQRNDGGMPVMAVQHIRLKIDGRQAFQHRTVIEGETLPVVHIAINAVTAKVVFIIDEIDGNTVVHDSLDTAILVAPADRHVDHSNMLHFRGVLCGNSFVFGQNHPYIHSCALQRFGQSSNDIGQPSRLDKRMGFGGGK